MEYQRTQVRSGRTRANSWTDIADGANVETIEHTAPISKALMSKNELRRFMSSKPPTDPSSIDSIFASAPKAKVLPSDDDPTETNNLKNDLALQRLIAESHLLDSYTSSSDGPTGSNRHKAMDLRIQSLGAKTSILTQKSMPLSHRRGITKKAEEREETRRKEAKENGIILEIAKSKSKGKELGKRERSVGGPGVGRFKGGTLSLSKNAIKSIEGLKRGAGGRGGRGGGRGRARGKSR